MLENAHASESSVLVVDDESLLRMYSAGILEPEGYAVFQAGSTAEAL